jgi:hypothetical protein
VIGRERGCGRRRRPAADPRPGGPASLDPVLRR